jgi:L-aspartate oxidase
MTAGAGVLRSAESLAETGRALDALSGATDPELHNLVTVGRALLAAATAREESRGAHARRDFPHMSDAFRARLVHQ